MKNLILKSLILSYFFCNAAFASDVEVYKKDASIDINSVEIRDYIDNKDLEKTNPVAQYNINYMGHSIPIIMVEHIILNKSGATIDEFAKIVSYRLVELAKINKYEFCSCFCKDKKDNFGATVTTIKSRINCPVANICPNYMERFGDDTIHNHLTSGSYKQSTIDNMAARLNGKKETVNFRMFDEVKDFSSLDLEHQGYMVSPMTSELRYQDGHGNIRLVYTLIHE